MSLAEQDAQISNQTFHVNTVTQDPMTIHGIDGKKILTYHSQSNIIELFTPLGETAFSGTHHELANIVFDGKMYVQTRNNLSIADQENRRLRKEKQSKEDEPTLIQSTFVGLAAITMSSFGLMLTVLCSAVTYGVFTQGLEFMKCHK